MNKFIDKCLEEYWDYKLCLGPHHNIPELANRINKVLDIVKIMERQIFHMEHLEIATKLEEIIEELERPA